MSLIEVVAKLPSGHRANRELQALVAAARALHDEQNGPPLIRREASWRKAMKDVLEALAPFEVKP
jgi:hypothetical protein